MNTFMLNVLNDGNEKIFIMKGENKALFVVSSLIRPV